MFSVSSDLILNLIFKKTDGLAVKCECLKCVTFVHMNVTAISIRTPLTTNKTSERKSADQQGGDNGSSIASGSNASTVSSLDVLRFWPVGDAWCLT